MTEDSGRAARETTECPPWCATDHEKWKYSHESEHTPICAYPLLTAAYAVGSADRGPEDHRVSVYSRNIAGAPYSVMSLDFAPQKAYAFAELLEQLAKQPELLGQLAAQVRTAAMAISGETS